MSQIFISYSRQHPNDAEHIKRDLSNEGYSVWVDSNEIIGGTDWQNAIYKAIDECIVLIAILTKAAVNSKYVQDEVNIALNKKKKIIPVVTERFQNVESEMKSLNLNHIQYINFLKYVDGYPQLLRAVEHATDVWSEIQNIINTLGHFNPLARKEAIKRLGETKDYRVVDTLIEANEKENSLDVKAAICEAFSNYLDDNRVISILLFYLSSSFHSSVPMFPSAYDPLRTQAAKSLGLLEEDSQNAFNLVSSKIKFWSFDQRLSLTRILLRDSNPNLRDYGLVISIVDLEHPDPKIRMASAISLGKHSNNPQAIKYLLPLLSDENEQVRFYTSRSLKELGHDVDEDKNSKS